MEQALLRYPNKSHRKHITFPNECAELAELLGIQMGDGEIHNPWQVIFSMNATTDKEYAKYIGELVHKLFNFYPTYKTIYARNTLKVICNSINMVDFMITKGAVRGNKVKQQITIPQWIVGNENCERAFVRGLVDTDGCLYTHKHKVNGKEYNHIGFCFTNCSLPLVQSMATILRKNGLVPHLRKNGTAVYLYSHRSVVKYLSIFGSSNLRITEKFFTWRDDRVA